MKASEGAENKLCDQRDLRMASVSNTWFGGQCWLLSCTIHWIQCIHFIVLWLGL